MKQDSVVYYKEVQWLSIKSVQYYAAPVLEKSNVSDVILQNA